MTYIYALHDPRTKEVRYVGKTKRFYKRIKAHYRVDDAHHSGNLHKANWIRFLRKLGMKPLCCILDVVEGDGAKEERAWIAHYRSVGVDLINKTDGGEAGVMKPFVIESARRANTGRSLKEDHKKRISEGLLAHYAIYPSAVFTQTRCDNIAKALRGRKGKPHTEESRAKISMSKLARMATMSEEERAIRFGRHHSPEVIDKFRKKLLGHAVLPMTRLKLREASLRDWSRRKQFPDDGRYAPWGWLEYA